MVYDSDVASDTRSLTPQRVHVLVQSYLDRAFTEVTERPQILDERIAIEGEWWTVPVFSPLEKTDRFNYYGRLADIEVDIRETEGLDIELIPTNPRIAA